MTELKTHFQKSNLEMFKHKPVRRTDVVFDLEGCSDATLCMDLFIFGVIRKIMAKVCETYTVSEILFCSALAQEIRCQLLFPEYYIIKDKKISAITRKVMRNLKIMFTEEELCELFLNRHERLKYELTIRIMHHLSKTIGHDKDGQSLKKFRNLLPVCQLCQSLDEIHK